MIDLLVVNSHSIETRFIATHHETAVSVIEDILDRSRPTRMIGSAKGTKN